MSNEVENDSSDIEDHWEIYVTYVDEKPAVIMVDRGIAERSPIDEKPTLVWLWVYTQTPDDEGFPSEDEDMTLNDVEDAVTESIDSQHVRYVGRITTDGRREFYFYTNNPPALRESLTAAMTAKPDYRFEIDDAPDARWQHYFDVLHPSPEDLQQIQNQQIISRLYDAGDSLTQPRPVDHFANFKTDEDRQGFISTVERLGFEVVSRPDRTDELEFPFSVGLLKIDSVDAESIDRITFELFDLAKEQGGVYDGWGCNVVKS